MKKSEDEEAIAIMPVIIPWIEDFYQEDEISDEEKQELTTWLEEHYSVGKVLGSSAPVDPEYYHSNYTYTAAASRIPILARALKGTLKNLVISVEESQDKELDFKFKELDYQDKELKALLSNLNSDIKKSEKNSRKYLNSFASIFSDIHAIKEGL